MLRAVSYSDASPLILCKLYLASAEPLPRFFYSIGDNQMSEAQAEPVRATPYAVDMVVNYLISRASAMGIFGEGTNGKRDIDKECRYPVNPQAYEYLRLYTRGDIAARIVEIWPKATWEKIPDVYEDDDEEVETEFEAKWKWLATTHRLWHKIYRADVVSGIGRYGGLFLGLPGSSDMPAPGWDEATGRWGKVPAGTKLAYIRVVGEAGCEVTLETDANSPRFGEPKYYTFKIVQETSGTQQRETKPTELRVHHTRIVHMADNLLTSEVFGMPRMERGLNRLMDIRKVTGGSGEMFWKGGFPGLSVEQSSTTNPVDLLPEDVEKVKEQLVLFQEGLQRYLALNQLTAKTLLGQIADPTAHVDINLRLLAIAYDVPMRILMGAEAGHLASTQDKSDWLDSVGRRRVEYAEPMILLAVVARLQRVGVLPSAPVSEEDSEKYEVGCLPLPESGEAPKVKWPDLYVQSEQEKADVLTKRTKALADYVGTNAKLLVPPLEFLIKFMGFAKDEAASILEAALNELADDEGFFNKVDEAQAPEPGFDEAGNPLPGGPNGGNPFPDNAPGNGSKSNAGGDNPFPGGKPKAGAKAETAKD